MSATAADSDSADSDREHRREREAETPDEIDERPGLAMDAKLKARTEARPAVQADQQGREAKPQQQQAPVG